MAIAERFGHCRKVFLVYPGIHMMLRRTARNSWLRGQKVG